VLILEDHKIHPAFRQAARILLARSFLELQPGQLTVAGYGISSLTDPSERGQAFSVEVPVASYACAETSASRTSCRSFSEFILSDRGREVSKAGDTCNGDSGGPALIPERVPRVLVGITSRTVVEEPGLDCGRGGIYGLVGTIPTLEWLVSVVPDLRIVTRW
jgi:secreted trypsin-like serine protease